MHRSLIASIAMALLVTPLLAAGAEPWPWKAKAPVDPALATLSHVDHVTDDLAGFLQALAATR